MFKNFAHIKMALVAGTSALMTTALPLVAYAADDATTGVSGAVEAVKSVMGLFASYPMNIFIGCGVALAAFKVFRGGKKASS